MEFVVLNRRAIVRLCLAAAALVLPLRANAQFEPHEPLDPAKAQSLPLTPLKIEHAGKATPFQVEVARTEKQHEIGLMHRNQLDADHGMLFLFKPPRIISFWMRNTFIPLDMIFTDERGTIIYIATDVQPHDESPVGPRYPSGAVLELNAGTAAHLGLQPGDHVRHATLGGAE
jgi:uncharacterized membrane protein (UPF0127 family)